MKERHALLLPASLRIGACAFAAFALMAVSGTVSAVDGKAESKPTPQAVTEKQPVKKPSVSTPKKDAAPVKKKDAPKKQPPAASAKKNDVKAKSPEDLAREKLAAQLKSIDEQLALADKEVNTVMDHVSTLAFMRKTKKELDAIKEKTPEVESRRAKWQLLYNLLESCAVKDSQFNMLVKSLAKAEVLANDKNRQYEKALVEFQKIDSQLKNFSNDTRTQQLKARLDADWKAVREIYGESLYQAAKDVYAKALKLSGTEKGAELATQAVQMAREAKAMYYTGNKGASDTDVEKAIDKTNDTMAKMVRDLNDGCAKISKYSAIRSQVTLSAEDPGYYDRIKDIEKSLKQAEALYRNKRYIEARKKCEEIFVRDPYNVDAVRLLDKIYRKLYFYAELRTYNEILRNDAETVWSWSTSIPEPSNRQVAPKTRGSSDILREKISTWIIDDFEIEDLTIKECIDELREKCKKADPEKRGLNIQPTQALSKAPYADRKVTLNLKKVPVNVILDYVTRICGVDWVTDRDGMFVTIGPDLGDHESRDIPMRDTIYRSITNKEDGDDNASDAKNDDSLWGKGGIDAGIEANGGMGKQVKVSDEDLKRFFQERGIMFDSQSSISYNRRTHTLSATNKRDQLNKLENLVREIDVETPLVMVEAKILEIQLADQEELGFDWIITHDAKTEGWDYGMASPLRDFGLGADKIVNNLNVIPNVSLGGQTKININLTITAVDRTDRIELLSTPKVVAKTGEEATIKMVRQMYFPESWSEPDTSNINGDSLEFEPSYPEFGDPRDVGLTFTVTPTVSSNHHTIELDLHPAITDLTGWTDYSYDVTIGAASAQAEDEEGGKETAKKAATTSHITMKMPEISNREVQTKVKVEDASTLVIGGMITDQQCNYEDQFPILGDIPVLGRFFRKVAKTTARKNLIISVSPRLISGDGRPLHDNSPAGVPDFYR